MPPSPQTDVLLVDWENAAKVGYALCVLALGVMLMGWMLIRTLKLVHAFGIPLLAAIGAYTTFQHMQELVPQKMELSWRSGVEMAELLKRSLPFNITFNNAEQTKKAVEEGATMWKMPSLW